MSTLEDQLTALLSAEATALEPAPDLLGRSLRRSRQRTVRRRAGVALSTVAAVAVGVAVPSLGLPTTRAQGGYAGTLTTPPRVVQSFPYTATYLPPTVDRSSVEVVRSPSVPPSLRFALRGGSATDLGVEVHLDAPCVDRLRPDEVLEPVQVRGGKAATLQRQPQQWALCWTESVGHPVMLRVTRIGTTDAMVRQIADGLTSEPTRGPESFQLQYGLAGTVVVGGDARSFDLGVDPDATLVTVTVFHRGDHPTEGFADATVGERTAKVERRGDVRTIVMPFGERMDIVVTTGDVARWTERALLEFAAGLTYSGPLPPALSQGEVLP